MAIAYAKFSPPTVLNIVALTLYTVPVQPASNLFRGGRVRFVNTTMAATSVTAFAVPVGGSAVAGNMFLSGATVPANSYLDVDVPIMSAGDFIQAQAGTAATITAHAVFGGVFSA